MARRSRAINTFSVSMLDVISSAMGAFLLLYLIVAESREDLIAERVKAEAQAAAAQVAAEAERIAAARDRERAEDAERRRRESLAAEERARSAEERARSDAERARSDEERARAELERAQAELAQSEAELERAQRQLETMAEVLTGGAAIAQCQVSVSSVSVSIWDHGDVDGDRVNVHFNTSLVGSNLELPGPSEKWIESMSLDPGINYVVIEALYEGTVGPNTAMIDVEPCSDEQSGPWPWRLSVNQRRHISIERL